MNAQVVFSFLPAAAGARPGAATDAVGGDEPGVHDAAAAITQLRLARTSSSPLPGSNGRLKST